MNYALGATLLAVVGCEDVYVYAFTPIAAEGVRRCRCVLGDILLKMACWVAGAKDEAHLEHLLQARK